MRTAVDSVNHTFTEFVTRLEDLSGSLYYIKEICQKFVIDSPFILCYNIFDKGGSISMVTIESEMTLSYIYNKVKEIVDSSTDTTAWYQQGLAEVELFCQSHNDHYYVTGRCNIDLNTLHRVAVSGLNCILKDDVRDRIQECLSILESYKETVEGV